MWFQQLFHYICLQFFSNFCNVLVKNRIEKYSCITFIYGDVVFYIDISHKNMFCQSEIKLLLSDLFTSDSFCLSDQMSDRCSTYIWTTSIETTISITYWWMGKLFFLFWNLLNFQKTIWVMGILCCTTRLWEERGVPRVCANPLENQERLKVKISVNVWYKMQIFAFDSRPCHNTSLLNIPLATDIKSRMGGILMEVSRHIILSLW